MKFLIALLCTLLLNSLLIAQQTLGLVWSPKIEVANGTLYDNIRPQVTAASGDHALVVWGSTVGGRKGFVSRFDGTVFSTPLQLNPAGQINAYTVEGPNIAAKGNNAYAVYTTSPTTSAKIMLRASTDGGQTWGDPVWVDSLSAGIPNFVNVGVMPDGHPIVMYMRQSDSWANPRYVSRRSTDWGNTYLPEANVSGTAPSGTVCDCCTGQIYPYAGRFVGMFRNEDNNTRDMWCTQSVDGGASFGSPIDLDTTDWQIAACPMSGPQGMLVGDSLYTVFMSEGANGLPRVWLGAANLADGGFGWNRMLLDTFSTISQNYPTIAGNGDTMVLAWMQNDGNHAEIVLRYSFNGPAGLFTRKPVYISEFSAGTQTFPDLVWEAGKAHLVYQDDAINRSIYRCAVVGVLAANSPSLGGEWTLQPNPSSGRVSLGNLPSAGQWEIFHPNGQILAKGNLTGGKRLNLDLPQLANGHYYLRIQCEGGATSTKRLVISR